MIRSERNKKQQDVKDVVFKRLFGAKPRTDAEMKAILQKEYEDVSHLRVY